jgi:hypothetical protein
MDNKNIQSQPSRQVNSVDINSLNSEQCLAFNIISQHHHKLITDQKPSSLHIMIVCGTAGTGKSYLINATMPHREMHIGMAAFNIGSQTLHSVLQLPVHPSNHKDLQGPALHRLQQKFINISYIIIDEMSMLGQNMFAWVDKRTCQATGKLDQPLGDIYIILFGDFAQLPPVGDMPLYASPSNKPMAFHG